jgi:hypothetical protein
MTRSTSLPSRWLKARGNRLFLNVFALLGAFVGLGNAALAWRLYGTSGDADVWMLAFTITQALCLLSQLGVEQFAVFSTEAHAADAAAGRRFDRDSMTWALVFGMACGIVLALAATPLVALFAHGYAAGEQARVVAVLLPLLLQVFFTPPLYVLRQQLMLQGRLRLSIVSNSLFGVVQLAVLSTAWVCGGMSPFQGSVATGLASAAISAALVFAFCEGGVMRHRPRWNELWPFIRASVAMRSTHSIHNFLVVLLTNSALSAGVEGTVALFQYMKKIADGLASISVGPHLSVYHAAQAKAWAMRSVQAFAANLRVYAAAAFPLLLLASATLGVLVAGAAHFAPAVVSRVPSGGLAVVLVLLAWQALISFESVPVGILVLDRRPELLLVINGVFVLAFFAILQGVLAKPTTALAVAIASLSCQAISTFLFSVVALRLWRRRMQP